MKPRLRDVGASTSSTGMAPMLGDVSPRTFMRKHWQKAPLLVREAVPSFTGVLAREDILQLACRDDVESRLVRRHGERWSLTHGPFDRATLDALPARRWTLLVQGVNLHVDAADALLRRFSFVPYARLDDLMVSYAMPDGGVGPHVDAYDVFLLQGFGRRRWRYGRQRDHAFRPDLPLRILQSFTPQHDAVLAPGDMLYLPPEHAHDGIAIDECTTYSIGFRAPAGAQLASAFLNYLQDHLDVQGRYRDPHAPPALEPARVPTSMQRAMDRMVREVRWPAPDVQRFIGMWLSEPKPLVHFQAPRTALTAMRFRDRAHRAGVRLHRGTILLYDDRHWFVNG